MTSLAVSSVTSLPSSPSSSLMGGGTSIASYQKVAYIEIPAIGHKTSTATLSLGGTLLITLSFLSGVSLFAFFFTLFSPLPYLSPKFNLFAFLLFGGLALELLWTKKLHQKNE